MLHVCIQGQILRPLFRFDHGLCSMSKSLYPWIMHSCLQGGVSVASYLPLCPSGDLHPGPDTMPSEVNARLSIMSVSIELSPLGRSRAREGVNRPGAGPGHIPSPHWSCGSKRYQGKGHFLTCGLSLSGRSPLCNPGCHGAMP